MNRNALASVLLLCVALASVVVGVVYFIRRDRAALVDQFAADRQAQVEAASREVSDMLDDAADDLRFAGELLSRPGSVAEHRRELLALLEVVGEFKAIVVLDSTGEQRFSIMDRRAGPAVIRGAVGTALTETAREALAQPPGEILTSPPVAAAPGGWVRVFATAYSPSEDGPGGSVAVLVDTEPYFAPLRLLTTQPEVRLLLLGSHGQPSAAISDATLAQWYDQLDSRAERVPAFASVVHRMRAGERGVARISESEAARLGMGVADAIAVFAPIHMRGGAHRSVAALVTTAGLRAHERGVILRVALGALLVTFFLAVFGTYVIVASRRAVALQESRRHADQLAHLHEKTQKILDNIPTGVLALSAAGRITAVNRALRERLPPTAVGASLTEAFPQAPAAVVDRVASLVQDACSAERVLNLHGEPLPLFGEEGQYRLHAVPLERHDAEVRVLLVVEDLSDVHALESQLLRAEKLATVGILAAGIAHEIGTPLGVVRGRAEYLLGKLGAQHAQAPGVQVIIEQIDRVSRTIRQLLDFSRVQPAPVKGVALGPLLRGAQELLHGEAERRKVKVEVEVPEALPELSADPDQLQQVVLNLALNACDACEPGGMVRIAAHVEAPGEPGAWSGVRVTVRDNGCGIPPESLNRVFDPFFTTKKRGQGTGLGLTVVAQIVRNHGGRIELESEPGQGTCVTLWWPATPAPSEERHAV